MTKKIIQTNSAPKAIGTYSQAVQKNNITSAGARLMCDTGPSFSLGLLVRVERFIFPFTDEC